MTFRPLVAGAISFSAVCCLFVFLVGGCFLVADSCDRAVRCVLPDRRVRAFSASSPRDGVGFLRALAACGVIVVVVLCAWWLGGEGSEGRYVVVGDSMSPALVPGQELDVDSGAPVQAGSVVVFEEPEGWRHPGQVAVKRVVAVAGDVVSLRGGGLWVNGRTVAALPGSCVSGGEATVPDGGVFVVGDNRAVSRDSMTVACGSGSVLDGVVSLSFVRGVVH